MEMLKMNVGKVLVGCFLVFCGQTNGQSLLPQIVSTDQGLVLSALDVLVNSGGPGSQANFSITNQKERIDEIEPKLDGAIATQTTMQDSLSEVQTQSQALFMQNSSIFNVLAAIQDNLTKTASLAGLNQNKLLMLENLLTDYGLQLNLQESLLQNIQAQVQQLQANYDNDIPAIEQALLAVEQSVKFHLECETEIFNLPYGANGTIVNGQMQISCSAGIIVFLNGTQTDSITPVCLLKNYIYPAFTCGCGADLPTINGAIVEASTDYLSFTMKCQNGYVLEPRTLTGEGSGTCTSDLPGWEYNFECLEVETVTCCGACDNEIKGAWVDGNELSLVGCTGDCWKAPRAFEFSSDVATLGLRAQENEYGCGNGFFTMKCSTPSGKGSWNIYTVQPDSTTQQEMFKNWQTYSVISYTDFPTGLTDGSFSTAGFSTTDFTWGEFAYNANFDKSNFLKALGTMETFGSTYNSDITCPAIPEEDAPGFPAMLCVDSASGKGQTWWIRYSLL